MRRMFAILSTLFILVACSKKEEKRKYIVSPEVEIKAAEILKDANMKWARGKEVEAIKLYDRLALEFSETESKKKAEAVMLKEGISIGAGLSSWTAKQMISVENHILDYREENGEYPSVVAIHMPLDAWGRQLYYKFFSPPKNYDFIVFSNGPDRLKGTTDDLMIVHLREEGDSNRDEKESAEEVLSINGEIIFSKEEIEKLGGAKSGDGELTMSLDEFEKMGSANETSSSAEQELSLEELMKSVEDNK